MKIRPGLAITVQTGHRVWMYLGSARSLFPRSFVLIAFTVMFSRLMSSNRAPSGRTYKAMMTCVVAGNSANNSSLKTAFGICRVGHGDHGKE